MTTNSTIAAPATPSQGFDRDPHLDLLRAGCIAVVVLWHWVFTTIDWQADGPHVGNPIPHLPHGWALTWLVQPMPLFFMVGGHLHRRSLDRWNGPADGWIRRRLAALLGPVGPLVAGFAVTLAAIHQFLPGRGLERALVLVISPLWFLAVYAVCAAMAPLCLAAHRRHVAIVPLALGGSSLALDAVRFSDGTRWWSLLSMLTVWGLVHHLGLVAWGAVTSGRARCRLAAGAGFALLAVAVVAGPYAAEMVGVQGKPSNFSPATAVIVLLAVAHLGLAGLAGPSARRLLDRSPRLAHATAAINRSAMPIFAWHLPAWGIAFALLVAVGFPIPAEPTALWWMTRPIWLVLPAAVLFAGRRLTGHPDG